MHPSILIEIRNNLERFVRAPNSRKHSSFRAELFRWLKAQSAWLVLHICAAGQLEVSFSAKLELRYTSFGFLRFVWKFSFQLSKSARNERSTYDFSVSVSTAYHTDISSGIYIPVNVSLVRASQIILSYRSASCPPFGSLSVRPYVSIAVTAAAAVYSHQAAPTVLPDVNHCVPPVFY